MSTTIDPNSPRSASQVVKPAPSVMGPDLEKNADLLGIFNSPEVYAGPRIVQVDLTNNCNLDCIACWTHSPLLGEQRFTHPVKGYTLPFDLVRGLIEDLARLGAEEIVLAGAGEPFLHPDIMEILKLITGLGLKCNLITNGTFLDAEVARSLVECGVSNLTVSVWAGDGETYARNHPSKSPRTFEKLVNDLGRLATLKAAAGSSRPEVKLTNVVSSYNAHNIREMLGMGIGVAAEQIELTTVDIVEGKTEALALSKNDAEAILEAMEDARLWPQYTEAFNGEAGDSFGSFFPTPDGLTVDGKSLTLTCRAGVEVAAQDVNERERRVLFAFPPGVCATCREASCPVDRANPLWSLRAMETFNVGAFLRRVKSIAGRANSSWQYDLHYIDSIPCTVGWVYSRVMVDGSVIPCCRGSKKPLGNLHEKPFSAIWRSAQYREFRHKALTMKKSDPYFAPIGCYKMCDNLTMIGEVAHRLGQLSEKERSVLEEAAQRRSPL